MFVDWSEQPDYFLNRGDSLDSVERLVFANSLHALDTIVYLAGPVPGVQVVGVDRRQPLHWQMAMHGLSERGVLVSLPPPGIAQGDGESVSVHQGGDTCFAPRNLSVCLKTGCPNPGRSSPSEEDRRFKPGFMAQAVEFLRLIDTGVICGGLFRSGRCYPRWTSRKS